MRKLLAILFALLFIVGGSASAVAAQGSKSAAAGSAATPAATPSAGTSESGSKASGEGTVDPKVGEQAIYYSKNDRKIATVSVTRVQRPWKDYGQYEEPDPGTEYVGITIKVDNVSSGNIKVQAYDFSLQDTHGHLLGNAYAQGKENAKVAPLQDAITLKGGDSETVLIVFKVDEGTKLAHLFWQPGSGILVTVADLAGK